MHRKIFYWRLRDRELQLGERTIVMGVLNLTPDSFSDGGRYSDPERAYARALELEEQGADIIDIGAESTRPGAEPVSADEEWRRLVPLLKKLRGALSVPVSIDTYKSETAERALQYDIQILNDPSGLTFDPALAKVAAAGNLGLVLNHMRGRPEQWARMSPMPDAIGTVARELDATVSRARHTGVDRQRIVADPGIGFGKRKEQNSELIAQLGHLAKLELPILVGVSRKSFLAQSTETETLFATAAGVTASILNGAHIVRVHDVKEMLSVVRVADEIARAVAPEVEAHQDRPAPKSRPVAKMLSWEEERPRPTRPPIRKAEAPPAADEATTAGKREERPQDLNDRPQAPATEGRPSEPENTSPSNLPPERPAQREKQEGTAPPRRFDRVPKLDRPARSFDKRPFERREENPFRGPGGRPPFKRPEGDRPHGGRPNDGRQEDRPAAGFQGRREEGRQEKRPFRKAEGERPFSRPGGDRSFRKFGDKPLGKGADRPFRKPGDRPFGGPGGDRRSGDRPQGRSGDRPFRSGPPRGDRPAGGRPGGRPSGRGPAGPRKPFKRDDGKKD